AGAARAGGAARGGGGGEALDGLPARGERDRVRRGNGDARAPVFPDPSGLRRAREAVGPPRAGGVRSLARGVLRRAVLMRILGISAHYHDSAAALAVDGVPICAVQEERLSRSKNDASFPISAIEWCLEHGGVEPEELDAVVFYEKPMLKVERVLTMAL